MASKNTSYDKPQLREKLKKKVVAEGRGGRPGQWSARKAQLLAAEYKKAGGGYSKPAGGAQKSLKRWTKEEWTTEDQGKSLRSTGAKRYLPKSAWKKLSGPQRAKANASKEAGDAQGKQFVGNPKAAKKARKKASQQGAGKKKARTGKKVSKKTAGASKKKASKKKVGAGKKKTSKKKVGAGRKKTSKEKVGAGKKKATARRPGKKKAAADSRRKKASARRR